MTKGGGAPAEQEENYKIPLDKKYQGTIIDAPDMQPAIPKRDLSDQTHEDSSFSQDYEDERYEYYPGSTHPNPESTVNRGAVNVQSLGKYSTQEGSKPEKDGKAQLSWKVQWSPLYSVEYNRTSWVGADSPIPTKVESSLNETWVMVPKDVSDIKISVEASPAAIIKEGEEPKFHNLKRVSEFSSNLTVKNGSMSDTNFGSDPIYKSSYKDGITKKENPDSSEVFASSIYPEAIMVDTIYTDKEGRVYGTNKGRENDVSQSQYKLLRIKSKLPGVHTVKIDGTIDTSNSSSDVYVPLRATTRGHGVYDDTHKDYDYQKHYGYNDGGHSKDYGFSREKAQIDNRVLDRQSFLSRKGIISGPLPDFDIKDEKINEENAKIYAKEINQRAGFYSTDHCSPTINKYEYTEEEKKYLEEDDYIEEEFNDIIFDDAVNPKNFLVDRDSGQGNNLVLMDLINQEYFLSEDKKYLALEKPENAPEGSHDHVYELKINHGPWDSHYMKIDPGRFSLEDSCDQSAHRVLSSEEETPAPETTPGTPTPETTPTPTSKTTTTATPETTSETATPETSTSEVTPNKDGGTSTTTTSVKTTAKQTPGLPENKTIPVQSQTSTLTPMSRQHNVTPGENLAKIGPLVDTGGYSQGKNFFAKLKNSILG